MSNIVIKVENLSKQYRLGNVGTGSLSHDINRAWYKLRGKEDPYLTIGESNERTEKGNSQYVWALHDINFELRQGEVMGIIGRNGAGKSTLLKILSRTTTPTTGSIKIKGRIASLLEVGTGFHPELTGRENIFLNGAILGMTRREIKSKFDEIVDFAGVERYIDTPVKRYSSGMYVRLAFGVAAHLEPEILIVDEVLAVGDAEFQKKALGKMKDVSTKDGRTVLFVSHNMAAIKSLCDSGMTLKNGTIYFKDNNIDNVVTHYYDSIQSIEATSPIGKRTDRQGDGNVLIESFFLLNGIGDEKIESGKQIGFTISYNAKIANFSGKILIGIYSGSGECIVFMDSSTIENFPAMLSQQGQLKVLLSDQFGLPPGRYFINIAMFANNTMSDYIQNALLFEVVDGLFYTNGKIPSGKGLCFVQQEWIFNTVA